MAAKTSTTSIQEQVLDLVRESQQATVGAVQTWADSVQRLTADVYSVPFADQRIDPQVAVDNAFGFAEQLLKAQHDFAKSLLQATKPVTEAAEQAKNAQKS